MSCLNRNQSLLHLANQPDLPNAKSSSTSNPFEKQALWIPQRFGYKSPGELVKTIATTIDFGSSAQSYLYIYNITDRDFEAIESQLKAAQLRGSVRFTFENALDAAILRIIPGPEHEGVAGDLWLKIVTKIVSIPGHKVEMIFPVGATRFQVPGVRSKEGDQGMKPETREGREAWPSLMIEVGYSEPINLLYLDAKWWLLNSEGRTRFVIIAKITRDPFSLHIECWMMGPPASGIGDRWIPKCVQEFDIDSDGAVTSPRGSTQLEIHYDCIFDESSSAAQPVIFTIPELSSFAKRLFRLLR